MTAPAVPPVQRRRTVGRRIVIAIAAAVILISSAVYKYFYVLDPPTLDSSTPRTQGDFTLVDVELTQKDYKVHVHVGQGLGAKSYTLTDPRDEGILLFRVKNMPPVLSNPETYNERLPDYSVIATPSGADSYPFHQLQSYDVQGDSVGGFKRERLPDNIVAFYGHFSGPKSWRYLDIKLSSKSGETARWLLTNLPHIAFLHLHPKRSDEHVTIDGLTINTIAGRTLKHGDWSLIDTALSTSKSPNSHYVYIIQIHKANFNVTFPPEYDSQRNDLGSFLIWSQKEFPGTLTRQVYVPFGSDFTALTYSGVVKKFALKEEQAVFHNLWVPIPSQDSPGHDATAKTPSGIAVLYEYGIGNGFNGKDFAFDQDTEWYPMDMGGQHQYSLPSSPLFPNSSNLITVQMYVKYDNVHSLFDYASKQWKNHCPNVLFLGDHYIVKNFAVTIGQTEEVNDTPFSITVPVTRFAPGKFVSNSECRSYQCFEQFE